MLRLPNPSQLTRLASLASVALFAHSSYAQATMVGPTPYLCFSDSPFSVGSYSYSYLETFEDHLFNVPGISANRGGVTSVVFGPSIHDSVDCDDGAIDGSGLQGDSFFSGFADITFTFNAIILGSLPTRAGLVWTDGGLGSLVTFDAFDANGTLLGTISATHGDSANNGTTAEDRFHGVIYSQGIGSIRIRNNSGGIEIDHIQYAGNVLDSCDSIDFNNDTSLFDPQDIDAFLSVYSEGPCIPDTATCNDIDFNNDGSVFDPCDIDAFLLVFSEGPCTLCGL
ncbi:MAG: hypothetical protein U0640_06450 [Phycisphaerales bacterium]